MARLFQVPGMVRRALFRVRWLCLGRWLLLLSARPRDAAQAREKRSQNETRDSGHSCRRSVPLAGEIGWGTLQGYEQGNGASSTVLLYSSALWLGFTEEHWPQGCRQTPGSLSSSPHKLSQRCRPMNSALNGLLGESSVHHHPGMRDV
jgi:hypothetical protein